MEEQIDEFDRKGNLIATHPKSYFKERMFLHRGPMIIPKTISNKFLFARRAKDKHPYADTWCCAAGGKSSSGETPKETAIREIEEELGKVFPVKEVCSLVYDEDDYKCIFTVFTSTVLVLPKELKLDQSEIQYVKAFSIKEILQMIENNPADFASTFRAIIKEFAKQYK